MKIPILALTIALFGLGLNAQDKPRLYVTTSEAWATAGGFSSNKTYGTGFSAGGSSPQTVEVIDQFAKKCPAVTVTNNREAAAFIVLFDKDMNANGRHSKIAVFRANGDLVYSGKTVLTGNAVKDACAAISESSK